MKSGAADRRDRSILVSIVVPAMNEAPNVVPLYDEISATMKGADGVDWELILVDDGSSDGTYREIENLAANDRRVRGLALSRNFGHQYALLAGLEDAKGDAVVSMDADLQHPPEIIHELVEHWRRGCNIVHTQRQSDGELTWFKRKTSDWFYKILSLLSGVEMREGQSDFRLLDRRVVQTLTSMEEADLFLRGLVGRVGFESATVPYRVRERRFGTSKYHLGKMILFAFSGITSISTIPLRLGIMAGFITSAFAFLEILFVLFAYWRGGTVPGWASVAGLVALLFGINFILVGFLGIYIGHIFTRVQRHPAFLVEYRTGDPDQAPRGESTR